MLLADLFSAMKPFVGLSVILQSFFIFLLSAEGERARSVNMQHCQAGRAVTLGCTFTPPAPRNNNLDVWWELDRQGNKTILFAMENDRVTTQLRGYSVNLTGLLSGNASLSLLHTAVRDEGVYTCKAVAKPHGYERTVRLDVTARPTVSLPELVTMLRGEERTFLCDISRFYPKHLKVTWQVQNGPEPTSCDICTTIPVVNTDGTYNMSSRITVQGDAIESDSALYTCVIEHKSFSEPHRKTIKLGVQVTSQSYDATILIAVCFVSSIFLLLLMFGGAAILYVQLHKDPPNISDIIMPSMVLAKTPTELKCRIQGVKARLLQVKWYKILSEKSDINGHYTDDHSLLEMEELSDNVWLHSDNTQHVSTLSVTLTTDEDGTIFGCVVCCGKKKTIRHKAVRVGVQPAPPRISTLPQIPEVGRLLVLCCRIEKFFPRDIHVQWMRQDGEAMHGVCQYGPFLGREQLYSLWTKAELTISSMDEGTTCTCRVYHNSLPFPHYKDITYHINTQGVPPTVMSIKSEPQQPNVDKECTLNLCVKDFCPDSVTVTWFRNGERLTTGVFNSPSSITVKGLYSMWTFLKLRPKPTDLGSVFSCQVEHSAQKEPEEASFTLLDLRTEVDGTGATADHCYASPEDLLLGTTT